MKTSDKLSMITESTFDRHMRRSMERLEEKLNRGERTIEIDIYELLHIFSRMQGLEEDRRRMEAMVYHRLKYLDDHFMMSTMPTQRIVVPDKCQSLAPIGKSRCGLGYGHKGHHESEDGKEGWS